MQRIRITRKFVFDMAHALLGYDGPCKNIHGHTYKLAVTFRGLIMHNHGHPKDGMVYDFSNIKKLIEKKILDQFDHCLVLSDKEDKEIVHKIGQRYEKLVLLNDQPTCENLLIDFMKLICNDIPDELELVAIRLDETTNSYAEWRIEDQA
ncbi:MAG: 6-carboxytetrahydropterin synthase [Saprospiraceae bacterium]|nr:6-carboxytetrahydropterin synthase [Saprospiraceae bacterium]MBK9728874.1 6-carboxytetrahydropterin synthase [Saprospiraceae bacterium]